MNDDTYGTQDDALGQALLALGTATQQVLIQWSRRLDPQVRDQVLAAIRAGELRPGLRFVLGDGTRQPTVAVLLVDRNSEYFVAADIEAIDTPMTRQ
jgi:hypothetical protein